MKSCLQVEDLSVTFLSQKKKVYAVQKISFDLFPGEVLGILGESGSGKSSIFQGLFHLLPSYAQVFYKRFQLQGKELTSLPKTSFRKLLGKKIGWVPQDPFAALNPYKKIGSQILETAFYHRILDKPSALQRALLLLEEMGVFDPAFLLQQYPHQLSGGLCQRVLLTMALLHYPTLLVADEPTTALDVNLQKQLIQIFQHIHKTQACTLVIISHDIGFLSHLCSRFLVMYAGKMVEDQKSSSLIKNPLHPYTQKLLQATFSLQKKKLSPIAGQPPSLDHIIQGCPFAPRCPYAKIKCFEQTPSFFSEPPDAKVACWNYHPGEKDAFFPTCREPEKSIFSKS